MHASAASIVDVDSTSTACPFKQYFFNQDSVHENSWAQPPSETATQQSRIFAAGILFQLHLWKLWLINFL